MLRPWTQAARSLARRPGFAFGAIIILAAGIAATTGVFSIVDSAVLRNLPYPNPDQLVVVYEANPSKSNAEGLIAPARLEDWSRLNRTFEVISGAYSENVTETSGDMLERLAARRVSPRYFSVFGVRPTIGRVFVPEEEVNGGPASAVISEYLWSRRFQRDSAVLHKTLMFAGRRYSIIGVMPREFADHRIDLWLPSQTSPWLLQSRDARFVTGIGRMKPGVTIAAAQRDLARVQAELGQLYPRTDAGWSAQVADLKTNRVGQYRQPLVFLLGAVALLLLIALANTAGLMLTHLQSRQGELAIRGFLGASRAQVAFGIVQEILILVLIAVACALVADVVLLRVSATALTFLPGTVGIALDWRALGVASSCGAAAAFLCGVVPAWRATRRGVVAAISRAGRGTSSDSRSQRLLVAGQIAVATLLLAGTGLLLRSYYNLSHVDPGFDASHAVTFHVGAAWDEDRVKIGQMQQRLVAALGAIPGVTAVGFSSFLPASNATLRYQVHLQDLARAENSFEETPLTVGYRSATGGYFRALGARISAGTVCPEVGGLRDSLPKALVNRQFVTTYARGRNVLGRYLSLVQAPTAKPWEIVGIVDDIREDNLRTAAVPFIYLCLAPGSWPDPEYVVRTAGDVGSLLPAIRSVVRSIDPSRAVFGLMPLSENIDATLGQTRLQTQLIAAFGLSATALAVIGLYGLVALAVTSRRREIGIRIALGAEPRRVVWELAARVGWLVAGGTTIGLVLTVIAQRELSAVVFGVAPLDPITLASAVAGLALAAAVATLMPARRAAAIDPVVAMREGE